MSAKLPFPYVEFEGTLKRCSACKMPFLCESEESLSYFRFVRTAVSVVRQRLLYAT